MLAGGSLGGGILEQAGSFSAGLLPRSAHPLGNGFCMAPQCRGRDLELGDGSRC